MSGEDDRDRPSRAPETSIDVPPPPLGPGDSNEERLGAISIPPASMAPDRKEATTDGSMYIAPETFAPVSIAPESFGPESIAPESIAPVSIAPEPSAPEATAAAQPTDLPGPFAHAAAVLASMAPAGAGEVADVTALDRGPPTMDLGPLDTVDLEAPDLDEDEPAELSSLVGVIPWQDE
ncbi:MAG: hypothetical protein ACI9U2_004472, partial [Bradymonadia bacterium]